MNREKQMPEAQKENRVQPKSNEAAAPQNRPEVDNHASELTFNGGNTESQVTNLNRMPIISRRGMVQQISRMQGNRHVQRLIETIQPKLSVSQPGDRAEQEADQVAKQVMTMPENKGVQRQEDDQAIHRSGTGEVQADSHIEGQLASSKGGGEKLPAETQGFMESRFGTDFSNVRVHNDGKATEMNQNLQAQAFTHGQDIYFNQGKYNPGTSGGKELLAHELTHVVQQTGGVAPKAISRQAETAKTEGDPKGLIAALHPAMQTKVRALLENAKKKGLDVWVQCGMRTIAEQDALYAKGRTTGTKGQTVTNAKGGQSWHNYGIAVDVVFSKDPWGEKHDWKALGQAGKEAGLEWGGDWTKLVDRPHFQLPNMTLGQLQTWNANGGMANVWKNISAGGAEEKTTTPTTTDKKPTTTPTDKKPTTTPTTTPSTGGKKTESQKVMDTVKQYDPYIQAASKKYGIPVETIRAIIATESNGNPKATSGAAFGLMQVTKDTWEGIRNTYPELKSYAFSTENWQNPEVNILFGTATMKSKMKAVGVDLTDASAGELAIVAYNAGEGTVKYAMQNARNGGSKNPAADCLKPEYLKPAIEKTKIYSYYLTGSGKKSNPFVDSKTGKPQAGKEAEALAAAIDLKYKEISKYPGKIREYMAVQKGGSTTPTTTTPTTTTTKPTTTTTTTTTTTKPTTTTTTKPPASADQSLLKSIFDGKKVLREGDSGDAVKLIQKMLITLGYSCGKAGADGDFGGNTANAVKQFQTNQKLVADAVVGRATITALVKAYQAASGNKDPYWMQVLKGLASWWEGLVKQEESAQQQQQQQNKQKNKEYQEIEDKVNPNTKEMEKIGLELLMEDRYKVGHAYLPFTGPSTGKKYKAGDMIEKADRVSFYGEKTDASKPTRPTWCNQFAMDLSKRILGDNVFAKASSQTADGLNKFMRSNPHMFEEITSMEAAWQEANKGEIIYLSDPGHIAMALPTSSKDMLSRADKSGKQWKFGRVIQAGASLGAMNLNYAWGVNSFSGIKFFKYKKPSK